jgi:hypothetical protein
MRLRNDVALRIFVGLLTTDETRNKGRCIRHFAVAPCGAEDRAATDATQVP